MSHELEQDSILSRILSIEGFENEGFENEGSENEGSEGKGSEKSEISGGISGEATGNRVPGNRTAGSRKKGRYGRARVRVTLETGRSFTIPERTALRLNLSEGQEMTEEVFRELMQELRSSCMQRCGSLLGSRDYPVKRLRTKLEEAEFPSSVIEECIEKLSQAHYLDDRRYAQNYVRVHLPDRSRRRIRQDLAGRGIAEEYIEEAFAAVGEETDLQETQLIQIRRLLQKRHFEPSSASFEDRQKAMAFLHRKGYETDLIRRAMENGSF